MPLNPAGLRTTETPKLELQRRRLLASVYGHSELNPFSTLFYILIVGTFEKRHVQVPLTTPRAWLEHHAC
jgi:hypothetical protein